MGFASLMRAGLRGLSASVAIAAGYFPVAVSFGLSAMEAGLSPLLVFMISVLVFAGASQFLMISLLAGGAGVWASVPTVLLMNARHMFYGPALQTHMPTAPMGVPSPALAFGLTDEVFATALGQIERVPLERRPAWFLGLACGAYAAWLGGTAVGVLLVGQLQAWPDWLQHALGFVLPALFFTLLLDAKPGRWKAAIGGAVVGALLLLQWLPAHHALALAIVLGAAAHVLATRRCAPEPMQRQEEVR